MHDNTFSVKEFECLYTEQSKRSQRVGSKQELLIINC